ncbi:NAD(P)-binding protein [Trematosphaeria pertusa]|uniref:NAD(P)-binding protein n=1 Tax=Trematosphaeria pertusa TaxID=390896 RepID=A0A6A6IZM6_9PLEO|nr:NAD(P)-binding protein [Trematosphaeria pertusa]KAF2256035.1 NAD(P)-binding protein [Trematosphaeria pertusa]
MPLLGVGLATIWSQFFPPKNPPITENNVPSLSGKVFIVTGGSSGIGYELSKILYGAGGKVYILSRTKSNVEAAIAKIKSEVHPTEGKELGGLEFIHMDLEDLASVQSAAKEFVAKEARLDVLFNNAGVAHLPAEKRTKQGLEYHHGVNSVGHVLLSKLLMPILSETAKKSPPNSARVVWPASIMVELTSPAGGVLVSQLDTPSPKIDEHYSASKAANWFAASEFAKRSGRETGVVSIAGNPGSFVTNVWRSTPGFLYYPFLPLLRKPVQGAYTYLWMGFSEEVNMDEAVAGRYATCDGRWHPGQREDLLLALKSEEEGGTGRAKGYFDWCEGKIAPFSTL